jgi:hypothetical protein
VQLLVSNILIFTVTFCINRLAEELKPILSKFLQTSEGTSVAIDKSAPQPQYATTFLTQVVEVF